jgi:cytochrome c oxidase assembly protein subunit 15
VRLPGPTGLRDLLRLSPRQYERVTFGVLFALGFIIVTGAGVRLTGSGLGCSEWPTCESGQLVASLDLHPMIEFVNRTITGLVSIAVILAVLGSLVRTPRRRDLTLLSVGLVAGVIGQIVLGAYAVKFGLAPALITAHFLVSIILVADAVVLHHRAATADAPPVPVVSRPVRNASRVLVASTVVVLVTGTMVTGSGPHAGDESAPRYGLAIVAIARIHSLTVWVLLFVALFTFWQLARSGAPARVDQRGRLVVGAIVAQGALGYAQYATGVPAYLVAFHILGSVLVFIAALDFHLNLWSRPTLAEPTDVATRLSPVSVTG